MTDSFAPRCVVVTGGAGFIGSNLVRWLLANHRELTVVTLDALTYAGNIESLAEVFDEHGARGDGRHFFVHGDIRDHRLVGELLRGEAVESGTGRRTPPPDAVLHLAAESHVDRSIESAGGFVSTNVNGTLALLEETRRLLDEEPRDFRFVNVSTDEVYGSLGPSDAPFTERHPLAPNSPYSASKAGADCLVRAFAATYGLPCITTRCSNNYGPRQFPEKLIPLMVTRAMADLSVPVYGDGLNVRDWIHVEDHAAAIWSVCTRGSTASGVYNVGGESEVTNLEVVRTVLRTLGKPESLIRFVPDRKGHDRRYAVDISRITTELGWRPRYQFAEGLEETVGWYLANRAWWERIRSEAYRVASTMYLGEAAT